MSIHIDQVLDYLDTNLVCRNADNMPSLMAALRDAYTLHDCPEDQGGELTAFSQGVLTGMLLMSEVNRLP